MPKFVDYTAVNVKLAWRLSYGGPHQIQEGPPGDGTGTPVKILGV
jgi:hypothetical protein